MAHKIIMTKVMPCPGSKIKSKKKGQGKGYGKEQGPIGVPREMK